MVSESTEKEKPGMKSAMESNEELVSILEKKAAPSNDVFVIAIDGRCASGKTTFAGMLADRMGAGVIHMDDFFLPMSLRTDKRLSEPGGNVHYERFCKEVLPCIKKPDGFTYRRFDCSRMELSGERIVAASNIRVVEGAYSCHPAFGYYADVRIFLDVAEDEQARRIAHRNGAEALVVFKQRWIPMEESYFTAFGVMKQADFVIKSLSSC